MKTTIVGSQKRALFQAKRSRFEKAYIEMEKAQKIAQAKGATEKQKMNFVIRNLRTKESLIISLKAEIARIREIIQRATEHSPKISSASRAKKIKMLRAVLKERKAEKEKTARQAKRLNLMLASFLKKDL